VCYLSRTGPTEVGGRQGDVQHSFDTQPFLTIVDLAGSERNADTAKFTSAQHRESAEIMTSLMALKQCMLRLSAGGGKPGERVPFRLSLLTMLLKDCFVNPHHRTTIIGTVSAISDDLEHTSSTLEYIELLSPYGGGATREAEIRTDDLDVKLTMPESFDRWTAVRVRHWLGVVDHGQILPYVTRALHTDGDQDSQLTGARLLKMSRARLTQMCGGDAEVGSRLFGLVREQVRSIEREQSAFREQIKRLRRCGVTPEARAASSSPSGSTTPRGLHGSEGGGSGSGTRRRLSVSVPAGHGGGGGG